MRDPLGLRGAVQEPRRTLGTPAPEPAVGGSDADAGGLGRRRHRPALPFDSIDEQPAAVRTGASVSVELHPVPSLWLVASTPPASEEARMTNAVRNYS